MTKVSVNAPRTPVTEASSGIAAATLPNVCKMPGPPAPFVPTPLPNIGKSGTSPKGYSKTVTIEGKKVAIKGASFGSMGDVASKGTGGGLISSNVEGPTSFVGPGSMNVKIEGKNVQLLGDPMFNNCGPSGSPANAATMMGVLQMNGKVTFVTGDDKCPLCDDTHGKDGMLKETKATKVNAQRLAKKLAQKEYLAPKKEDPDEDEREKNSTMLGVIQCKCKAKHYADRSGQTDEEFCTSVTEIGWHGPRIAPQEENAASTTEDDDGTTDNVVLKFLRRRFPNPDQVERVHEIWDDAEALAQERRRKINKALPGAYKPGRCAAPKALMLVMEDEAYPAGITEQWFHSRGKPTSRKIKFHDRKSGLADARLFGHGETVPPCETCNLLLPLMLCPKEKGNQCQHKTKN